MLEFIIEQDKELLIFLNNLGSEHWDALWLGITNQLNWTPLFLLIFYLIFKSFGFKKGLFVILSIIILIAFSDQLANFIKESFHRVRPNNDLTINHLIRNIIEPQSYSFVSGHAMTSSFFTIFIILLFKDHFKKIYLLLLFPLIFGYSRIYLGVHFPLDVFCGYLVGVIIAVFYHKLFVIISNKLFS